jgi:subtilisin family serine protease
MAQLLMIVVSAAAYAAKTIDFKGLSVETRKSEKVTRSLWRASISRNAVVQARGRVDKIFIDAINGLGLEIVGYIPQDSLLVRGLTLAKMEKLELLEVVAGVISYVGPVKVAPPLRPLLGKGGHARELKGWLLGSGIEAEVRGKQLTVFGTWKTLDTLSIRNEVEWIELAKRFESLYLPRGEGSVHSSEPYLAGDYSDLTGYETGTQLTHFEEAWTRGYSGEGEIISIADSGLDSGDLRTLSGDFSTPLDAIIMGAFSDTWADEKGHGTHVSGIALGKGTLSNGLLRGAAYGASLIVQSMWSFVMKQLTIHPDFDVLMGVPYEKGARIHSNSWGMDQELGAYNATAVSADEFVWEHPEMLLLFAVGNAAADWDGDGVVDRGSIGSPATAKNVLSIGASENLLFKGGYQVSLSGLPAGEERFPVLPLAKDLLSDSYNGLLGFSGRGPTLDGRRKPDIVAPGSNILGPRSHYKGAGTLWGVYNAHYVFGGGSSMAVPLVSGGAAIAREYLRRSFNLSRPPAALIKALLLHSAKDLYPGQFGLGPFQEIPTTRPNNQEGFGRLDMEGLFRIRPDRSLVTADIGVEDGQCKLFWMRAEPNEFVRGTLVYTDAPGRVAAASALVNDLDLTIEESGVGTISANDHVNNTELVEYRVVRGGEVKLTVCGTRVVIGKGGRQPFSLVVTVESDL